MSMTLASCCMCEDAIMMTYDCRSRLDEKLLPAVRDVVVHKGSYRTRCSVLSASLSAIGTSGTSPVVGFISLAVSHQKSSMSVVLAV